MSPGLTMTQINNLQFKTFAFRGLEIFSEEDALFFLAVEATIQPLLKHVIDYKFLCRFGPLR
jgi:hypothetical protein